jgi:membrane-associated phospholipid phosphatase
MQWYSVWSLARLLFPFAALVTVSRLILGLHYHPSDVLA